MRRRCYICDVWVTVNVEAARALFEARFEGEDITEAVIICENCDQQIQDAGLDLYS